MSASVSSLVFWVWTCAHGAINDVCVCVCVAGAVDEKGRMPFYAEECASMLAVTFSSGGNKLRNIVGLTKTRKHMHNLVFLSL